MNEQPPSLSDEQLQAEAARAARARLDDTESVDPMTLVDAKRAEIEQREADAAQRAADEAKRAEAERAELERRAAEMAPSEEEIKQREAEREAKEARMKEMAAWANVTGAVAEGKARKSAENETRLKTSVEAADSVSKIDYAAERYYDNNQQISAEDVVPDKVPGTDWEYRYGRGGSHNVIDENGTTRSTVNGIDTFNRSPSNVRNEDLPHGSHNNPDTPTFR